MRPAFWIVLVSVPLTSIAMADTSASAPSVTELAAEARRAQASGHFAEAIDIYSRAYQLTGDKNLLFELAQTQRRAGHADEARRLFQTYLRRDPQGAYRDSAARQIQELTSVGGVNTSVKASSNAGAPASPSAGGEVCAAVIQSAERLEHDGQWQAARASLAACLSPACPGQLRADCERRQAKLSAAIPAIVLVAKDEASHDVTAVHVTMDGRPLVDRIGGDAIPVDPGEHRFAFEAAGFRRLETTVDVRAGNKRIRVLAYLNAARTSDGPEPTMLSAGSSSSAAGASVEPSEQALAHGWSRKLALGLGGAGVAGLAVGTVWAIMSKSKYDHALASECDGDPGRCSPQGIADGRTAHQQATVATVGFVAAGVLLSAGAAVYLAAPRQTQLAVAPSVADRSGALTVVGQW